MNIQLEPIQFNDLEFVWSLRNSCRHLLHHDNKFTLTDTHIWFEKTHPQWQVIRYRHNDGFRWTRVGYVRVADVNLRNQNMYVGCDIVAAYRKRSMATEALRQFRQQCIEHNTHKWFYEVIETNIVSMQFALSFGFKLEGVKREAVYRDGKYLDSLIFGLVL